MTFPTLAAERNQSCQELGRVLTSSSPTLPLGQLICVGDTLLAPATVLCLSSGQVQQVRAGQRLEDQGCAVTTGIDRNCGSVFCRRPKGGSDNALILTNPAGTGLFDSPTQFSWEPVPLSQHYLVQVEGEGVKWTQFTASNTLVYPSDQPRLQPGRTYRVSVIAIDAQGNPLSSSTRALNILNEGETQRIQNIVRQLQQLKLPPDELAAIDLKSLYLANGLVGEAIRVLELRAADGSLNARVYQALGQCYARARNPFKAKVAYHRAIELAQSKGEIVAQMQQELNHLLADWNLEPTSH